MQSQLSIPTYLSPVVQQIRDGDLPSALIEARKLPEENDLIGQKVRVYLLLANQKFPEADSLCTKLLSKVLDHELLGWRGIAKAELGLWSSSLQDLCLAHEFFPQQSTLQRIDFTTHRACKSISEGMQLDGGTYKDYLERAKIYILDQDFARGARDTAAAETIQPDAIELRKLKATIAFANGRFAEALTEIEPFLEANPDDLDAILLKTKVKAATGRLRGSLALLRQAAKEIQDDEIGLLKVANCRSEIRDFHGAIKDFNAILKSNPESVAALFGRGKGWFEIRKYDEAIEDFQQALNFGGPNAAILAWLGESKLATGAKKEASSAFKSAMKLESRYWPARLGYAKVKNMRNKRTEAIKIASDLLKRNSTQHEIHLFLGSAYFDEKDFVTSIDHFSKAFQCCRTHFERASCLYRRGTARLENEDAAQAIDDFDKALELRPYHVGTLVWRGYANGKLGKWAQAIADLQSAIDMNPMAAEQYQKLGEFIANHALNHFGQAIKTNKASDNDFFNRGMAHQFLGNKLEAFSDFEKTLALNPKHGEAQVRLGTLYLKNHESKKAYSLFTDAVQTQSSATALLMRADAMLQLGVLQPALLDIRNAIRTSRDNDRLYARRGELYVAQDNLEKALDDFTLSIALNFDNFQGFRERGRLFVKKGMLKEAVRDFSMSLHFFPQQPRLLVERAKAFTELGEYDSAANDFEMALGFENSKDPSLQLPDLLRLDSHIGRAKAIVHLERGQEGLAWLTKAIHRFSTPEDWAKIVKARSEIFLSMGRFERASADARIASKLLPDPVFSADCYYLRALCSFYHKDREHTIKTLEKAYSLDENHEQAELALDWFRQMAEEPPENWKSPPKKIRPQRPKADANSSRIEIDTDLMAIDPPMDLWLVKKEDQEFGPIPLKTVVEWANEGRIDRETRLFRTDWGKWKTAGKLTEPSDSAPNLPDLAELAKLMEPPGSDNADSNSDEGE